jgi:tetratricopeptide (TPR) repeat protein
MYFWMRAANITAPYGPSTPTDSSAWDSLGKILSAYGLYLKLMAFPYPHSPFIATLPTSPLFLMASALIVAALGGGFLFAVVRRHRIVGMGLGWTLVLLAPAGAVAIQPLAAAVAAERYVYAPSVGFVIVEAWVILNGLQLIQAAPRRLQRQWTVAAVLLVIVVISAWGWESWKRNAVWRTPVTFWEAAVLVSPETGFPHGQLGLQYARLGRQDDAEKELLFAIKQMNSITDQATALSNLGNLYSTEGRYQDAVRVLKTALDQDPTNDEIYWHMAELFFAMSARKDETTADGKRVTDYDPALFADGENYLKRALELRPMLQLYFEAGTIYMSFGKLAEAEAYFQKILDANPNPKTQLAIRTKQRLAHLKSGSR